MTRIIIHAVIAAPRIVNGAMAVAGADALALLGRLLRKFAALRLTNRLANGVCGVDVIGCRAVCAVICDLRSAAMVLRSFLRLKASPPRAALHCGRGGFLRTSSTGRDDWFFGQDLESSACLPQTQHRESSAGRCSPLPPRAIAFFTIRSSSEWNVMTAEPPAGPQARRLDVAHHAARPRPARR